jgi:GAF domain-containing protein
VGRCVQEGNTIFMTDIPEDYIKIKSGLGEDNPRSLLIVPIRLNEKIIGVIEIASLEIFQDFQIEFVERIGSSIASSLSREQRGSA